jgi:ABC-type arginine transport system permease subunit
MVKARRIFGGFARGAYNPDAIRPAFLAFKDGRSEVGGLIG